MKAFGQEISILVIAFHLNFKLNALAEWIKLSLGRIASRLQKDLAACQTTLKV